MEEARHGALADHALTKEDPMSMQRNDEQWTRLQSQVEDALPEENWMLRQLETGVDAVEGGEVVQVMLERQHPDLNADQVIARGATAEDAVREAIALAQRAPLTDADDPRARIADDGSRRYIQNDEPEPGSQ